MASPANAVNRILKLESNGFSSKFILIQSVGQSRGWGSSVQGGDLVQNFSLNSIPVQFKIDIKMEHQKMVEVDDDR